MGPEVHEGRFVNVTGEVDTYGNCVHVRRATTHHLVATASCLRASEREVRIVR